MLCFFLILCGFLDLTNVYFFFIVIFIFLDFTMKKELVKFFCENKIKIEGENVDVVDGIFVFY